MVGNHGRDGARRIAHTLKGLAGTFGLGDLRACAAEVEAALKTGDADVEHALDRCRKTLERVMAGLAGLGPAMTAARPVVEPGAIDWPRLRQGLETLRLHLGNAEMTATHDFEALQAELAELVVRLVFKGVGERHRVPAGEVAEVEARLDVIEKEAKNGRLQKNGI